jgi:hypothetical protein
MIILEQPFDGKNVVAPKIHGEGSIASFHSIQSSSRTDLDNIDAIWIVEHNVSFSSIA